MMSYEWIKESISSYMNNYQVDYIVHDEDFFCPPYEINFENEYKSGHLDIWDNGCIGILLCDLKSKEILMNVMILNDHKQQNIKIFDTFLSLL